MRPNNPGGSTTVNNPFFANRKQQKNAPAKKKNNPLGRSRVIDYLDQKFLQRFVNDQGKILPRRITGFTAFQQRELARAIRHARHLALLPFVSQDVK